MGTTDGARKGAAKRLGVAADEYRARLAAGSKWCFRCRSWHPKRDFGRDRSREDGLSASCLASGRVKVRRSRRGIPGRRGWLAPTRGGDRMQARRRINYLVEQGRLPRPVDLPCIDCGDMAFAGRHRHEYDHARGYGAQDQLYVEPVCARCHHDREETRRG